MTTARVDMQQEETAFLDEFKAAVGVYRTRRSGADMAAIYEVLRKMEALCSESHRLLSLRLRIRIIIMMRELGLEIPEWVK